MSETGETMAGHPLRRRLLHRLMSLGASVLVLTALGPFGTFLDFSFTGRLAYWGGLIFCGWAIYDTAFTIVIPWWLRRGRDWRVAVGISLFVASVLQTGVVAVVESMVRGKNDGVALTTLPELFVYVLLVSSLVSTWPLHRELRARGLLGPASTARSDAPAARSVAATPATNRFQARIPGHLTGALMALEMEDHYLRVHTTDGSTLILMRLRDAVEELADSDGLQVHRSFWVAAGAVVRSERDGSGRVLLCLANGLKIPVSRSRLAAVRDAGWLRDGG